MATKPVNKEAVEQDLYEDDNLPAAVHHSSLTRAAQGAALGQVINEEEIQMSVPSLSITHGVGRNSDQFTPGDLILGDDTLVCPRSTDKEEHPVSLILATMVPCWRTYAYDPDVPATVYLTQKEAAENGATTEWQGNTAPTHSRALLLSLLLVKPEGVESPYFNIDIGLGAPVAKARMLLHKTAYKESGEYLLNAYKGLLKRNLISGMFSLQVRAKKLKSNTTMVPVFSFAGATSEAVRAAITAEIG